MSVRSSAKPSTADTCLRDGEAIWRSLVESSMDAVLMTAPDGRIFSANPAAVMLFGYSEQELIQLGRNAVVDVSDPCLAAALVTRERDGKFRGEIILIKKNGERFPAEISTSIFFNSRNEACTSMVIRDVTERRRRDAALQMSEASLYARNIELTTILESTPAITLIAHDPECRYITGSKKALQVLRLPHDANASKSAPPGQVPENFRIFQNGRELLPEELPMQKSAATGQSFCDIELTLVFSDNTRCEILGSTTPLLDSSGKIFGSVGTFLDITERRRAEEKIRQSETALRALAKRLEAVREEERLHLSRAIHDELGHALTKY